MKKLLLILFFVSTASATEVINTVRSTGVDINNNYIPSGEIDPNYRVFNQYIDMPATVVDPQETVIGATPYFPGRWTTLADAKWVSFGPDPHDVKDYIQVYNYETTFDLSGYSLDTVSIVMNWAATYRTYVSINDRWATYNLQMQDVQLYNVDNKLLLPGINKMKFQISNPYIISSSWGNGLLVSMKGYGTPVPEPSSAALSISAIVICTIFAIKKREYK